jgi:DNA repair protein RadC
MKSRIKIDKMTIKHPSIIYEIMQMVLKKVSTTDRDKEHFWVLALNQDNKLVNLELVALGANDRVGVTPAEILAAPLQKEAKGIMLVHNHPSGNLKPSEADKDLTDRMIQACRLMEVPLLDHVIITEKSYFSFQEAGLLERLEGSNKYIPPYDLEKMSYQGGWEEGKADAIEEIAKQMLAKGLDMQLICQMTGLSTEKIQELLNSSKERI